MKKKLFQFSFILILFFAQNHIVLSTNLENTPSTKKKMLELAQAAIDVSGIVTDNEKNLGLEIGMFDKFNFR